MSMIVTEGLCRRFGEHIAVDGLDLDIAEGEVFGFLGPNGAGKTTTVRMLCGLIAPSAGTATVNGHAIDREAPQVRASVGILTETPGLYTKLDAVQNLHFFAELQGVAVDAVQPKIRHYLEVVGLWDRRDEPVGGFSKGMRQRLAIARALLHEPPVLFLDEPTAGLDPVSARSVRELVERLRGEGRTIVICTHNLDEAERLCDRVGVMRQRMIRVDSPARLRRELYGRAALVQLASVTEKMVDAAAALPFVETVTRRGEHTLRVVMGNLEAHNPALIETLVGAGADVQFVDEDQQSLEQVYFDLLADTDREREPTDDAGASAGAEAA